MKKLIAISMAALALASCTGGMSMPSMSALKDKVVSAVVRNYVKELDGREFKMTSEGYNKNVTIGFKENRVFGYSGINRYFGTYQISGDKIKFSDFGVTKMGGKEEDMIQELKYLTNLKDNENIKLEGDILTLTSEQGLSMTFKDVNAKEEVKEIKK